MGMGGGAGAAAPPLDKAALERLAKSAGQPGALPPGLGGGLPRLPGLGGPPGLPGFGKKK
jgi:signal recognition particle subunit SRP54